MKHVAWLVVLIACGKHEAAKPPPAPPPQPGSAAVAPVPPDAAPLAPAIDVIALATATKAPALFGPFAKLTLTPQLTGGDVVKAAPDLCAKQATVAKWCEMRFVGGALRVERLPMDGEPDSWPVERLRVSLPGAGVRERLVAAWGEPQKVDKTEFWFAPAAHLRVGLHAADLAGDPADWVDLDFEGYTTLDEFIGHDKKLFGFEKGAPMLGMKGKEIAARYKPRVYSGTITLWPVDAMPKPSVIHIGGDDSFATADDDDDQDAPLKGYRVDLSGIDSDVVDKPLRKKFGPPHDGDFEAIYRRKPKVATSNMTTLTIGNVDE